MIQERAGWRREPGRLAAGVEARAPFFLACKQPSEQAARQQIRSEPRYNKHPSLPTASP